MTAPPILGISEIVLSVSDLPRMRAFYQEVLGFPLHSESSHRHGTTADSEGPPTICFLTIAATETPLGQNGLHPQLLVLIDYQQHVFAKSRFDGHDVRKSTLNHLAFEIDRQDFQTHWDRLESLQLSPTKTEFPQLRARAMFFKDPEGNTLELICRI